MAEMQVTMTAVVMVVMTAVPPSRERRVWGGEGRAGRSPRLAADRSKPCLRLLVSSLLSSPVLAEVQAPPSCPEPLITRQEVSSPLETLPSQLALSGSPLQRHKCPPDKEGTQVGPPDLYQGPTLPSALNVSLT